MRIPISGDGRYVKKLRSLSRASFGLAQQRMPQLGTRRSQAPSLTGSPCFSGPLCDAQARAAQAKELIDHLESVMLGEAVEVVSGLKYVECKPRGLSKGTMVQKLLAQVKPDFVLCVGDDKSDEQMFETLVEKSLDNAQVFACTVGQKPSRANFYVNDNAEARSQCFAHFSATVSCVHVVGLPKRAAELGLCGTTNRSTSTPAWTP